MKKKFKNERKAIEPKKDFIDRLFEDPLNANICYTVLIMAVVYFVGRVLYQFLFVG